MTPQHQATHPQPWSPRAHRTVATLLLARLMFENEDCPCRIRELAPNRMLLEAHRALTPGAQVTIELRTGNRLGGTVAWTEGARAEIALTREIDPERFLAEVKGDPLIGDGGMPNAPGFEVHVAVRFISYGCSTPAELLNLSQTGARVRSDQMVPSGQQIMISIPGLPVRRCIVGWRNGSELGITFLDMIPFALLANWLPGHRDWG